MSRRHLHYRRPLLATLAAFAILGGTAAAAPAATPEAAPTTASPLRVLDDTYYQDALGKSGTALKSALHEIISDQTKLSYSQVWEASRTPTRTPPTART